MIKVNKLLLILTCSFAFGLYQPECSAGIFKKKKKMRRTKKLLKKRMNTTNSFLKSIRL